MAVISDIAGTSNESFSINGRSPDKGVTLFQGNDIPDDLVGNEGDIYFSKEGLIYIKRNGNWLSHGFDLNPDAEQPLSLKWLPDPRNHNNILIYSNGENYAIAEGLKFNENNDNCLRLTSSLPNNVDTKYVPNIEWINKKLIKLKKIETAEIGDGVIGYYTENYWDKNDNIVGYQDIRINEINGSSKITFSAKSLNNTEAKIELVAEDNNTYAKAPTPPAYATGNEIATIEWISHNTSSKKLGEIVWLSVPTDDSGLKLLNGQRLSKIGYEDFWNHLKSLYNRGFTYIHYEDNNDTTIIRDNSQKGHYFINNSYIWLPDWSDIVVISPTSNDNEVGEHKEAGLPDFYIGYTGTDGNGAPDGGGDSGGNYPRYSEHILRMGSTSNTIYGNSTTVQPEAIKYYAYVVVLTNINGDYSQLDIDELVDVMTEFNNNSLKYPDYTAGVSLPISGTIENNGWIQIRLSIKGHTAFINDTLMMQLQSDNDGGETDWNMFPVKSGDTYRASSGSVIFFPYKQ